MTFDQALPAALPNAPVAETHNCGAVVDWLLQEGRQAPDAETLIDEFGRRLNAIGLPLARSVLVLQLLHPQIRSMIYFWRDNGARCKRSSPTTATSRAKPI